MLTLYYHPLACSLGAQIALLQAQAPHQLALVDLAGDRTAYRRINPLGTVPALQTPTGVLTESTAILLWLAQRYPQAQLLPQQADGLAQGVSFLAWLTASAQAARRQAKFPGRFTADAAAHAGVQAQGRAQFMQCLGQIDARLAQQPWVLPGAQPSACDAQLMVYAHWCALDGQPLDVWPHWQRWCQAMLQRSAVQQALAVVASPLRTQGTLAPLL